MRQHAITTLSLNTCLDQINQELSYLLTNCIDPGQYDLKLTKWKQKLQVLVIFQNI